MNIAKAPRPFNFKRSVNRWMVSAGIVPNIFRQLFIRKFNTLLVARGTEWDRRSLQVAMEVLLKHHREPVKAADYLKGVCRALAAELRVAAEYMHLKDGEEDIECPGVDVDVVE